MVVGWPLLIDGNEQVIPIHPQISVSDGEATRQLLLTGAGIARLAEFMVREDLAAGRLIRILEQYQAADHEEIHAVFLGQGGPLPYRVSLFLDFLYQRVRIH